MLGVVAEEVREKKEEIFSVLTLKTHIKIKRGLLVRYTKIKPTSFRVVLRLVAEKV